VAGGAWAAGFSPPPQPKVRAALTKPAARAILGPKLMLTFLSS